LTDNAPKPGTGRLGRAPRDQPAFTWREVRAFARSDFARRLAVLLAGVLAGVILIKVMTQPGGLPAATSGLFRADTTPLSPARYAHLIWVPALVLVLCYVVWVWLPFSLRSRRVAVTAYPATAAILLMSAWLWAIEAGKLRLSVVLVIAAWTALVVTLAQSSRSQAVGIIDRQVSQLPYAVLLGWMTVMGAANLAVIARVWGFRPWQVPPETWWVMGVVAVLAVAMALVRYLPGRLFIGGAVAWGLFAVAYGRLLGQPRAYLVGVACVVSALLILAAALAVLAWFRSRNRH